MDNGTIETVATRKGTFGIRAVTRRERTRFLAMHAEAGEDIEERDFAVAYLVGCSLLGTDHLRVFQPGEESKALDLDADVFDAVAEAAMRCNLPEPEGKAEGATPTAPSRPSSP